MLIICFDFDGVIAEWDGWKGEDIFGLPIRSTIDVMKQLKEDGHKVIIWTTRRKTPVLLDYLSRYDIPYDSVNSTDHNPPGTSQKPIFDIFIDDRAIEFKKENNLLFQIYKLIEEKGRIT
jgi:adenylylsulfate kinase